jgi:hypothetical protein
MSLQLNRIEMDISGVGVTSFDIPTSMTPYGTREAISFNKFKFDSYPIEDGGHYVEVGSHNGLLGFYVARLFPKVNVHLFECNPLMIKAIQYGIIENRLNNVTVYPFGLSDSNRTILSTFDSIDYLKIDIEGEEFRILNSLIQSDSKFLDKVKTLNLELHDNIFPNLNLDRSGIKEFISQFKNLNVIYQD